MVNSFKLQSFQNFTIVVTDFSRIRNNMWKTIPILSVLIIFGFSSVIAQIRPPPKVTLSNGGTLLGSFMFSAKRNFIEAYRGIPYAKPPIGNLRFAVIVPFRYKFWEKKSKFFSFIWVIYSSQTLKILETEKILNGEKYK